jgi:hypothetical protein
MISAFQHIGAGGMGKPEQLAGDIGVALITTAFGLIIAIPAMLAYFFFKNNFMKMMASLGRTTGLLLNRLPASIEYMEAEAPFRWRRPCRRRNEVRPAQRRRGGGRDPHGAHDRHGVPAPHLLHGRLALSPAGAGGHQRAGGRPGQGAGGVGRAAHHHGQGRRRHLPRHHPVPIDEVGPAIKKEIERVPALKIYLRADRGTPHKDVREVMKRCAENGAVEILFAAYEGGE